MCGISGILNLSAQPIAGVEQSLQVMNKLLQHRGPDDEGVWVDERQIMGLAHRRLSIIDLSESGHQPMVGGNGSVLVHNGEIYNFMELRKQLSTHWQFVSHSDTEVILAAYYRYGIQCVQHLRGMFAFALWDGEKLFCARDRFGIKPFYYTIVNDQFLFASEAKALLPFVASIETDGAALAEYLTFQFPIGEKTLFKNIHQLLPGHALTVENGQVSTWRYWDVSYEVDFDHTEAYFKSKLEELLDDSLKLHLRSDVPIGSYLSGGIDSSLIAIKSSEFNGKNNQAFHGKFTCFPGYDESYYAQLVADSCNSQLNTVDITADDFRNHLSKVIYHLDYPVAGPGSFPQYMVSKLASESVKVVLGGQGGDEIFGGYARYLVAYFEQTIKAAIDGTYQNGNFVVTAESIIPNLGVLREYKPMIAQLWKEDLFGDLDDRYFRLVNRANDIQGEINWDEIDLGPVKRSFKDIFNNRRNVGKEAYFDSMTHFDFKTLLPALLHVEDRMSMAHGLESRVPLLDHPLIECMATVPADIKFKGGHMKHLIKQTFSNVFPAELINRRDKMGFPVPLNEWIKGDLNEYINDIFHSNKALDRPFFNNDVIRKQLGKAPKFSRKLWGLLSLELWQQSFHDKASEFRGLIQ